MEIDWKTAKKPELKAALKSVLSDLEAARDTIGRLLNRHQAQPAVTLRHIPHPDDSVPPGWAERHAIAIPRSDGIFESATAWVRIKHGVIIGAGLKNQSILHLAISLELLDQGAEYHANLYRDWRAAFLSRVDPGKLGDEGSDSVEAWTKEDRYRKLLIEVDKDYMEAMDCIVAIKPKARHLAAFQHNQQGFVDAFHVVARAMADIERRAEEENSLARL
jgi:hypothetical protein